MDILDVLSILSLILILVVLRSLRREHIRVEHSVSWLVASFIILVLSRAKNTMGHVAAYFSIGEAWLALLILVLIVFLGVFYRFSRVISELKDMNITLTQRVAILEYQLERTNEEERA